MAETTPSLQTPLAKARGLGSARDGTHHWWMQRMTALAMIPLVIWFVISVIGLVGSDLETFQGWLSSPFNAIAMVLLVIATFWHATLGIQVVIEDYIASKTVKIMAETGVRFAALILCVIALWSILKISFGA